MNAIEHFHTQQYAENITSLNLYLIMSFFKLTYIKRCIGLHNNFVCTTYILS